MFEKEAEEIEKEALKWVKDVFPNDEFKQSGISRALVEFAELGYNKANERLIKAKEIILTLINNFAYPIGREDWTVEDEEIVDKAEQFISEVKMTKYEELMNKSDECCLKAIEFARKCDWNMATFYKNASIGFKEKALKLNVSY